METHDPHPKIWGRDPPTPQDPHLCHHYLQRKLEKFFDRSHQGHKSILVIVFGLIPDSQPMYNMDLFILSRVIVHIILTHL